MKIKVTRGIWQQKFTFKRSLFYGVFKLFDNYNNEIFYNLCYVFLFILKILEMIHERKIEGYIEFEILPVNISNLLLFFQFRKKEKVQNVIIYTRKMKFLYRTHFTPNKSTQLILFQTSFETTCFFLKFSILTAISHFSFI